MRPDDFKPGDRVQVRDVPPFNAGKNPRALGTILDPPTDKNNYVRVRYDDDANASSRLHLGSELDLISRGCEPPKFHRGGVLPTRQVFAVGEDVRVSGSSRLSSDGRGPLTGRVGRVVQYSCDTSPPYTVQGDGFRLAFYELELQRLPVQPYDDLVRKTIKHLNANGFRILKLDHHSGTVHYLAGEPPRDDQGRPVIMATILEELKP